MGWHDGISKGSGCTDDNSQGSFLAPACDSMCHGTLDVRVWLDLVSIVRPRSNGYLVGSAGAKNLVGAVGEA